MSTNKASLEHTPALRYHLWLPLYHNGRVKYWPASWKYLLSGPLWKKISWPRDWAVDCTWSSTRSASWKSSESSFVFLFFVSLITDLFLHSIWWDNDSAEQILSIQIHVPSKELRVGRATNEFTLASVDLFVLFCEQWNLRWLLFWLVILVIGVLTLVIHKP